METAWKSLREQFPVRGHRHRMELEVAGRMGYTFKCGRRLCFKRVTLGKAAYWAGSGNALLDWIARHPLRAQEAIEFYSEGGPGFQARLSYITDEQGNLCFFDETAVRQATSLLHGGELSLL